MKKLVLALLISAAALPILASGIIEKDSFDAVIYRKSIEKQLGTKLDEPRIVIADATWLWYSQKWNSEWTRERFDYAVEKGSANCRNEAMIAAAKTGKFGEKVLKALIVAAGDAAEAFSDWVEKNSSRY